MTTKNEQLEAVLNAEPSGSGWSPRRALKERRAPLTQRGLSVASGVAQGHISDLEAGRARLTSDVAKRLAPALKSSPEELVYSAYLNELEVSALRGRVDPQNLLDQARRMAEDLPAGEVADSLIDALYEVIRVAVEHYDPLEAEPSAALKSQQEPPRRDGRGVRLSKPNDPHDGRQEPAKAAIKEQDGPRRDANGYKRNKPFSPEVGR